MGPFGFKEDRRRTGVVGVAWGPWGCAGFRGRRRDRAAVGAAGGSSRVAGGRRGLAGVVGVGLVDVVGGFGAFGSVVTGATTGAVVLIRPTVMSPRGDVVVGLAVIGRDVTARVDATPVA